MCFLFLYEKLAQKTMLDQDTGRRLNTEKNSCLTLQERWALTIKKKPIGGEWRHP